MTTEEIAFEIGIALSVVAAFTLAALLGYLVAYIYYHKERRELVELKQEERKLREFNKKYER